MGESEGRVAIFQGVQQDIGPIELSHVYERTTITLSELPLYYRNQVEATVNANDLEDARRIVDMLSDVRNQ